MRLIHHTGAAAIGLLVLAGPTCAQTSSWNSTIDPTVPKPPQTAAKPAVKPKAVKPPAHSSDPLMRFQKRQVGSPAPRPEPQPTAEDAALLAFEKGEFLTALTLAGQRRSEERRVGKECRL